MLSELALCLLAGFTAALQPPTMDKALGIIQQCNAENPCPAGQSCLSDPLIPGILTCFDIPPSLITDSRSGSCPSISTTTRKKRHGRHRFRHPDRSWSHEFHHHRPGGFGGFGGGGYGGGGFGGGGFGGGGSRGSCQFDFQCPTGQKCCLQGAGYYFPQRSCTTPIPIPTTPTVTVLQDGKMDFLDDGALGFNSAISLVQAAGKNILVDTGTSGQKQAITKALLTRGLSFKDIDYLVTTHGHPDHYQNDGNMPDVSHIFNTFLIHASRYDTNPLGKGAKYYLTADNNVEVIQTPGHTLQDVSLLVRNTKLGTVAIVGDLIYNSQDAASTSPGSSEDQQKYIANRKLILCTAHYVVGGHGPMFRVDDAMKKAVGC